MSQTDQDAPLRALEHRVAELERTAGRGLSDRYARLYAPIAVTLAAMSGLPPFNDVFEGGVATRYGTLWDMARTNAGDPAVFGLLLLGILVVLLVVATFRVRQAGLPAAMAVLSTVIALMLIAKPGTGIPTPELSGAGVAGLAILAGTAVLAMVHAVQLSTRRHG